MYDNLDDLPRDCEVPIENMSEDEYIYRLMKPRVNESRARRAWAMPSATEVALKANPEGPMYMGFDIDIDDLLDWD